MAIYALVAPGGAIINMVNWDGSALFNVSPNTLVAAAGNAAAQIGGTYLTGVFTAPSAPAPPQGIIFVNSPASGATVALPNAPQPQAKLYAYLQPAGALASLTLVMPPNPQDGDVLNLLSSKAVTTLTMQPATGQVFVGPPTTLAAGAAGALQMTYSSQLGGWFQW